MICPRSLRAKTKIQISNFLSLSPNQPSFSQYTPGQTHGGGGRAGLAGITLRSMAPPSLKLRGGLSDGSRAM